MLIGISAQNSVGMRSIELQEMYLNYACIALNAVKLKGLQVGGRSGGDVAFFQQIDLIKRIGAMLMHYGAGGIQSLYEDLEG